MGFETWVEEMGYDQLVDYGKDEPHLLASLAFAAGFTEGKEEQTPLHQKLDLIIAQTAPKVKKIKIVEPACKDSVKVIALFNRYFKKNIVMTEENAKFIKARFKDEITVDQIESYFQYVSTSKWWAKNKKYQKFTTLLNAKLPTNLQNMDMDHTPVGENKNINIEMEM